MATCPALHDLHGQEQRDHSERDERHSVSRAIVTRFECYESSIACGIVAGNLCRCADYDKILTSVMRAAEITRGA